MIRSLYGKLSAILLVLFLFMGVIFVSLSLISNRMYFQEASQKLNRSIAKHLVANRMLMKDGEVNQQVLAEIYYDLMDINPSIEVYMLDTYGHVLSSSIDKEKIKQDHISMEPVFDFLGGNRPFPILGDNPTSPGNRQIFSACPIPITGTPEAYLYIILGKTGEKPITGMLKGSYIARMSVYVAVSGLILVSLFGLYLFRNLTGRLRRLTSSVESFREDGFEEDLDMLDFKEPDAGDEIDILGAVFGRMAKRITDQMTELESADSLRRELVTNVSHDLRTPLTSLQGYLETLIMKEDLTEDQRNRYLETALKHSDMLRKLVADLFELSRLDAHEVRIDPEAISLCELIQDILQKFQLFAQERDILLNSDFEQELPFALADIGLVERAIENLIQNAMLYTPPGGKVTVSIRPEEDRLLVQVNDTGRGIAEEDLPFIFDRYFRVADGEVNKPAGTGLGLSIAKRIIELHGQTLEVVSEINKGSTFTFSLPLSSPESHECKV